MTRSVLRHRWFVMGIIFLARTTMAMQFQSIAPVAPLLIADLGISYAELGLLIGLYLLPGTVLALPGGLLGQRFGNRRVALWGLALMVGGQGDFDGLEHHANRMAARHRPRRRALRSCRSDLLLATRPAPCGDSRR